MKLSHKVSLVVSAASLLFGLATPLTAFALVPAVAPDLGTAASFSVFAGSSMSADGSGATISADLGINPGLSSSLTGAWSHIGGSNYFGTGGRSGTAQIDATAAYTSMNRTTQAGGTTWDPSVLEDMTPAAGLYKADASPTITGELILNGDASSVWIFQIEDSLTFAGGATVTLGPGVSACNVYWYIKTSATITGSLGNKFVGTLIANSDVSLVDGPVILGRMMARTGSLTTAGPPAPNISGCAAGTTIPGEDPRSSQLAMFPPLINITKIPTPLALPDGPGPVTYDYTVLNVGLVAMNNVTVTDNKCTPASFISGDTNNDLKLDTTEVWKYRCSTTLATTTTNTVIATGKNSGNIATDLAEAIVVVGAPVMPPLIHLVKVPNKFVLPVGGGLVVYQYFITNPGTVPLSDVGITDNKCTGLPIRIASHIGDLNKNGLLDPGETWNFSCVSNLTKTTTNIGTATGHANGFTVTDISPATVVVAPTIPKLPNTGLPPEGTATLWSMIMAVGVLMLVSVSFVAIQKKIRI